MIRRAQKGYKHWYYGYRRKDLASGIVEDFTLFNNTRNVTLDDGSIEIEHFTNAKRFPAWLAVSNSTHHPAIARRLTNRTSIHTYFATKAWKSDQIAYVGLSGKVQRNADCGDGIMVRIAVDNQTVYERDIPPSKEMVEISWDVHFNVGVGTVVEVQVDPKKDDACDPTLLWARLYDLDAEAQW